MTNEETNKDLLTEDNSNDLSLSEQQEVKAKPKLTNDILHEVVGLSAGSKKEDKLFGKMIYNQLKRSCRDYDLSKDGIGGTLVQIITELKGIEPKDQIEGMLATQMIATHHAALDNFAIAAESETIDIRVAALSSATKLTRTYVAQMEALNRYRGKGQQKMTVEHVHINSGGQAIIGNVTKNVTDREGGEEEKLKYEK